MSRWAQLASQFKTSVEHAVKVNNQASTLLEYHHDRYVFVFHDNRIFVFENLNELNGNDAENNNVLPADSNSQSLGNNSSNSHKQLLLQQLGRPQQPQQQQQRQDNHRNNNDDGDDLSSSSTEQNIILNILTTTWIRFLSMVFIVFRLFDNSSLVVIVVLSLLNGILTTPDASDLALIAAVGLETFYDVMINVNKYWVFQRLSFYIGLSLYAIYYSIVLYHRYNHVYSDHEFVLIIAVLSFRLAAFILEILTDIGIDYCIHNELVNIQNVRNGDDNQSFLAQKHMKSNRYFLPPGVSYLGSFNAWGIITVKKWSRMYSNLEMRNQLLLLSDIHQRWLWLVFTLPAIVASTLLLGVFLIILGGALIFAIFVLFIKLISYLFFGTCPTKEDIKELCEEFIRL